MYILTPVGAMLSRWGCHVNTTSCAHGLMEELKFKPGKEMKERVAKLLPELNA